MMTTLTELISKRVPRVRNTKGLPGSYLEITYHENGIVNEFTTVMPNGKVFVERGRDSRYLRSDNPYWEELVDEAPPEVVEEPVLPPPPPKAEPPPVDKREKLLNLPKSHGIKNNF